MWCGKVWALGALVMLVLPAGTVGAQEAAAPAATPPSQVAGFAVSSRDASLTFHLADGSEVSLAMRRGTLLVNGDQVAEVAPDGPLAAAWATLLSRASELSTDQMLVAAQALTSDAVPEANQPALSALQAALAPLAPGDDEVVPAPRDADASDAEAVVATEAGRALRDEARAMRDAARNEARESIRQAIRGAVRNARVEIRNDGVGTVSFVPSPSVPGGLLALLGSFIALAGIAFGASFFAERQLDIVADTASASLARSFFVGLFAQPLIVPAFGMLLVGLTLTVVGIILIPFAVIAFLALLAALMIGGYLAMARAAGESFARRTGMRVDAGATGTLRKTGAGLAIVLAIWAPAVLLGWVPVAGTIVNAAALLATWAIVTTGFGAAILTRGGLRGTFGRKFRPRPLGELAMPAREVERETRFDTNEWLAEKDRSS